MRKGWADIVAILIDSNVLIYMFDGRDEAKRQRAIATVLALADNGEGRLSTQCLFEFFSITTKSNPSMPQMLSTTLASQQAEFLARSFETFPITAQIVLEAMRGVQQFQLPFWDAQIWAAARLNQIPVVLSEDFKPNSVLEGVRFINPLAPDFDLKDMLGRGGGNIS
jgi:predicted nucleic acid-binding protein